MLCFYHKTKIDKFFPYKYVTALLFGYTIFKEMRRSLVTDTQDIVWAVPLIVFGSLIFMWICCCCVCVCSGPSSDVTPRPVIASIVAVRSPIPRFSVEEDPV